jgi:hypothetical protein
MTVIIFLVLGQLFQVIIVGMGVAEVVLAVSEKVTGLEDGWQRR